ncbi:hypothetical protein [Psychrobacter sp. I-STPA6b]|uniref:hypothetical protein n=1 Tax=Psychrobacter sp. I-STPA6b TaxID=2585718 RepID=UPI001D0CD4E7|nr:hypothetical protein [Psychrobacter sp. I-STPA6b]
MSKFDKNAVMVSYKEGLQNKSAHGQELASFDVANVVSKTTLTEKNHSNMGLINRVKSRRMQSDKSLEVQQVICDTQVAVIKDQAQAIRHQSKAHWDVQIATFVEGLKVKGQRAMQNMTIQKGDDLNDSIATIRHHAQYEIDKVSEGDLSDMLKEEQIKDILSNMYQQIDEIKNKSLAKRYDLD